MVESLIMEVNLTSFFKNNVTDTCAVWNILSSLQLFQTSIIAGCSFCCTKFVIYECLHKPRIEYCELDEELKNRLKQAIDKGYFNSYHISIEDLQDVEILRKRKNISKGELSSMVFAKKTGQAFLTDDQKARKLAAFILHKDKIQTTPHLFGWLFYSGYLNDADKDIIIMEHKRFNRPLEKYFDEVYLKALELKLFSR